MQPIAELMQALYRLYGMPEDNGVVDTPLPGVRFFWATQPGARCPLLYNAGIIIIGQGHKTGYLGDRVFTYGDGDYLVVGVPMPFECETHASPEKPLLGIFIGIDSAVLHEVVALVSKHNRPMPAEPTAIPSGIEPVGLEPDMGAASGRLLTCLQSAMDCEALGPGLVKEILYRAVLGGHGCALYALTQHDSVYARVAKALRAIHRSYAMPLSVEDLAKEAGMSVSAFHRAFKQVTSDSPLQYVKKIRLNTAMRLILHDGLRSSVAAQRVGYESAPQFSRDFKRYFHIAPTEARATGYTSLG